MDLDASQSAFCGARAGNIRLLAPAGCGKTHSLLHRCRCLTEASPGRLVRFLVVTFTVAARDELKSRLAERPEFAGVRDNIEVTTLNAWGYRRIKSQAKSPRLLTDKASRHFAVSNQLQPIWIKHKAIKAAFDASRSQPTHDILELIDALKSLGFDHTRHRNFDVFAAHAKALEDEELGWRLTALWERLVKINVLPVLPTKSAGLPGEADPQLKRIYDAFYKFWLEATKHLIESATFTLEDQKYFAFLDERQKANGDEKPLAGAARYDHVIVDEFQDINPLDLNLIKAIVDRHRATLTIVGDDDQAIYEWRGTTPSYILNPAKFFGGSFETFTLGVNYRSPANVVELSQKLIRHNKRRVDKKTKAFSTKNAQISVEETEDVNAALELAHAMVKDHVKTGTSPTRIALVGRKKAQLIPYQIYFASKDVPFCAAEDLHIFLSKTFDQLLHLLEIKQRADTPQRSRQVASDLLALCHLVKRYPVKKAEAEALTTYLSQNAKKTVAGSLDVLAAYAGPLKGTNADRRMSADYADAVRAYIDADSVSDALNSLSVDFEGLAADFGKAEDDIFYKDPPFGQLADFARRYGDDYNQFLDDVELAKEKLAHVPPTDDDAPDATQIQRRPLHLMTALRAKGKEFESVVLLDCVEDIWPMKYAQTPAQLEAERRVFYVAFTRAKARVVFQVAKRVGKKTVTPSRYLSEIGLLRV